jgi:hypothetical protein
VITNALTGEALETEAPVAPASRIITPAMTDLRGRFIETNILCEEVKRNLGDRCDPYTVLIQPWVSSTLPYWMPINLSRSAIVTSPESPEPTV